MASIADQILIKMGLDSSQLEAGLNRSKQQIGATTQAMDKMGAKWVSTAKMLTTTILAPVAGFMSLGAVIKSYFGGVAQVAQLTGAYNTKMEEWRKKRAMLARYNKEDIELYKKGREAVVKFQITMDDLSAKIMRSVSPAVKWLIDKLNNFSDWIDRNSQNIIRFLGVVAGTITALLIPSFIKLGIAMLTNPLTWIIALLGILILIIDDLVTYLRGGDSALGAFWKPLIEYTKTAWEWITKLYDAFVNSTAFKAFQTAYSGILKHLINGLSQLWDLSVEVFNAIMSGGEDLNGLIEVIVGVFNVIGGVLEAFIGSIQLLFGAFIAVFTGDTEVLKNAWIVVCDSLTTVSKGAFKIIDGIFKSVKNLFTEIVDVINNMIDAILNFGSSIRNALNIDSLIAKVKKGLSNILPDWVKSSLGIDLSSEDQNNATAGAGEGQTIQSEKTFEKEFNNKENNNNYYEKEINNNNYYEKETIYKETDAPIVYEEAKPKENGLTMPTIPQVAEMQSMKAQSKGNVNNNINRSQVINIGSNNPAVATATMREADYEMNNADRTIAMASQGAGW